MSFTEKTKEGFNKVADHILDQLQNNEAANINLSAEDSTFIRFNNNKVRQNTQVEQRDLTLLLQKNSRSIHLSFSITGNIEDDKKRADQFLELARKECDLQPEDPFQVPLQNNGQSDHSFTGNLLNPSEVVHAITGPASGSDLAGLYCAGPLISANKNSKGQSHWFANENFFMDYSLYIGEKAVKAAYAGTDWNQKDFETNLAQSQRQLSLMNRPKVELQPGAYRTYLAPGAVAELASMLEWGALSFNAYKQGSCGLAKLADKEKTLSPLFSVRENYGLGLTHRFNSLGELAPETLDLISQGELKSFLVSTRSAKEYTTTANAAEAWESPRAMEILPGTLQESDILKNLDTGLYLSNLHYLNWSDRVNARITGMTRYACFWVEKGEIVGPIKDLRFDENLYDCLGQNLLGVTNFQETEPQTGTYNNRSFGGKKVPGMLIKDFKFTL